MSEWRSSWNEDIWFAKILAIHLNNASRLSRAKRSTDTFIVVISVKDHSETKPKNVESKKNLKSTWKLQPSSSNRF